MSEWSRAPILAFQSACVVRSIAVTLYDQPIDEGAMAVVTVSPKFQVVIPRHIREALRLLPGQKVQALQYQNRIEFIPIRSMREMRGFLKGINSTVPRDKDRV
jgi:AbrB family looped-hinge helix DNA binding protein